MKEKIILAVVLAVLLSTIPFRGDEQEHRDLEFYSTDALTMPCAEFVVNVSAQTISSSNWSTRFGSDTLAEQPHTHREDRGGFRGSTTTMAVSGAMVARKNFRIISGFNPTGRTPGHDMEYAATEADAIKRCDELRRQGKDTF